MIYLLFTLELLLSAYLIAISFTWRRVRKVHVDPPVLHPMYGGCKEEVDRLLALDSDQNV